MSDTASPSLLQPPPKRAPGVKRLNSVPKAIAAGVVLVFAGGIVYTAVHRSQQAKLQTSQQADGKKQEGAKSPAFLNGQQDHGEVQASLDRQLSRQATTAPASSSAPASSPPSTPPAAAVADQSGSDVTEQARLRAWQAYYQSRDALQAKRFEMDMQALSGGNGQQGFGQSSGMQGLPGSVPGGGPTLPATPVAAGGTPGAAPGGVGGPYSTGGTDPSAQTGKQAFLRTPGDVNGFDENLQGGVHGPKPDTIMEGTAIPGRLVDGATSDMPGQIVAEITSNICDTMNGNDLLIPHGTRVIGTYDIAISAGQDRLGVIWNRLVFPDTSSRQLGSMQGADQGGAAGLKDQVDTHLWEKIGSSLLISIAGAAAQLAQPQQSAFSGYSPTSVAAGALTQQFSQLGQAYAQRGLSIPNTINLRSGLPMTIRANKDIPLPPYVDQRGESNGTGPCNS